tara:strand:+ start:965 stop:2023 length:1059 start_codon:yes stop_codon:yes gene_type:complete
MLIREAKLEDYSQIYSLNLKHNLNIPNKEEWTKIWNENPDFNFDENIIGWVIEDKNKIKGFLGFIKKKYFDDEGNEFNSLISHNWVVDKDCRSLSLNLLNKFFNHKKFDFYINSTASFEVAKVWEALGAKKIPLKNIQSTLFVPINNEKISGIVFKNSVFKFIFTIIFKYFTKIKIISGKKNKKYNTEIVNKYDEEIKKFKQLNNETNYIQEKINYGWYIDILSKNCNVDFLKIRKDNILVGYCILITSKTSKLKKTYLAQIQIKNDYKFDKKLYNTIVKKIYLYSKDINSDLVEIKYIDEKIFNILKKIIIFNRNYKYCSFYYYSPDKNMISKLSKKKWIISMFSGDSFLI